jgi:hypothetical protein
MSCIECKKIKVCKIYESISQIVGHNLSMFNLERDTETKTYYGDIYITLGKACKEFEDIVNTN